MTPFFFFNDTATTEIYTLSLHDALPICVNRVRTAVSVPDRVARRRERRPRRRAPRGAGRPPGRGRRHAPAPPQPARSEEHTSELQSRQYLVCRLLLEKKTIRNMTEYSIE